MVLYNQAAQQLTTVANNNTRLTNRLDAIAPWALRFAQSRNNQQQSVKLLLQKFVKFGAISAINQG